MTGKNPVIKYYLKSWTIKNYYKYDIYQVMAGDLIWFEATPVTPGTVTRTSDDEKTLKIMLENDCINAIKFQQRVR